MVVRRDDSERSIDSGSGVLGLWRGANKSKVGILGGGAVSVSLKSQWGLETYISSNNFVVEESSSSSALPFNESCHTLLDPTVPLLGSESHEQFCPPSY
jgi:hypothetical protein